ncbi:MAG: metallophosphoesterase family protein [Candidatus Thorarchaeota archaeon]
MAKFERVFYTCDIHGSELTFRKFLNAPQMYGVKTVIMAGDLTGKGFSLVEKKTDGTYVTQIYNEEWTASGQDQLETLERKLTTLGFYYVIGTKTDLADLKDDPDKLQQEYDRLAFERMADWVRRIEEKFKPLGIKIFVTPGNDDRENIADAIAVSDYVVNPEGEIVMLTEYNEMLSDGHSNPTPWHTPREVSEEELARILDKEISKVEHMESCVFNIHVPPKDTLIDSVTDVDPKSLKRDLRRIIGAGSTAVREAIEKHQPLLGLHGHIHESRGEFKLGRTLCLNPGSEYAEGILRGVICAIDKKKVRGYQFTSG